MALSGHTVCAAQSKDLRQLKHKLLFLVLSQKKLAIMVNSEDDGKGTDNELEIQDDADLHPLYLKSKYIFFCHT